MKRKRLDRDIWTSIRVKEYQQVYVNQPDFHGIASLLNLIEVSPVSIWGTASGNITVCESGMKWMQLLPESENYFITAKVDREGKIVVVYIDVIDGYGFDSDGVAFYNDLYLDMVLYQNGDILINDKNELIEAYDNQIITQEQYDIAEKTQDELLKGILKRPSVLMDFCYKYLRYMTQAKPQ